MKPNTYKLMCRAVEEGMAHGWRKVHKHNDNPDEDLLLCTLEEAVTNELCEWFNFDDEEPVAPTVSSRRDDDAGHG